MARLFDGISDAMTASSAFLSASAGPFVVGLWFKPANLSQSSSYVMHSGSLAGSFWAIRWESVSNALDFTASGGSSFATSSSITLDSTDVSNGCRVAWRYRGAGSEWSKWKATDNGGLGTVTKTVINASLTATLPTLATAATILSSLTAPVNATIAEVWIAQCDASDEQMQEILRGVTADQLFGRGGALKAYWPLRGNNAPDPDYAGLPSLSGGSSMAVTGVCEQATHPTTYGRDDLTGAGQQLHAWVLEVEHEDETIYAASTDLYDQVDMDVLGRPYPGLMSNGGDISVGRSIVDGIGTVTSPPTIILSTEVNTPAPLRPGLCTTYPTAVALDRPVSYWRMGDSATTLSGTTQTTLRDIGSAKLHASISGSVTLGATGALTGDNNKAMTLSGSSSNYASVIAGASALDLTSAVTVECWMKPAATTGSFGLVERTTASGTSNKQWALFTYYTGGVNYVYWRGIKSTTSYNATYTIGASMSTSAWMHIVGTYDGNNLKLYVNGVLRSTTAVGGALDTASNGIVFLGRLGDTSYVLNGSLDEVAIYDHALSVDQVYRHYKIGANGPREWRDVPCRLRRYERSSHELVTELSGVVVDSDWSISGRVALTINEQNHAVTSQLIPKTIVNVEEFATGSDVGAPIPVAFGAGYVSAPHIAEDETDPGGSDFAISHTIDASNAAMTVRVKELYFDQFSGPGLEKSGEWATAPGTITYVDADQFSVGSAVSARYEDTTYGGIGIRFKTTASGSAYVYSHIVDFDTGTNRVQIADSVLDSGLNSVQIRSEYTAETNRHTSGGKALLTVRFPGASVDSGIVALVNNTSLQNPASVIKEILSNTVWGLSETVNSGSFTAAATDYSDAGLATACDYVLGGDRQQRDAANVLRELLSMRGAWLTRDDDGAWQIYVDKARATPWRSLTYAQPGSDNNVKALAYSRQRPLGESVSELNLRYGPRGRVRRNDLGSTSFFDTNDFVSSIFASSMSVGATSVIVNPWLRSHSPAARVADYLAQRIKYEDVQKGAVVGISGRNVQLGEIVNGSFGNDGSDGQYRVTGYTRRIAETNIDLVGYNSAMFTYDSSRVTYEAGSGTNTQADTNPVQESTVNRYSGANFIRNAGFLIDNRKSTPAFSLDPGVLPGWICSSAASRTITVATAGSNGAIGGGYLQVDITGSSGTALMATNSQLGPKLDYRAMPIKQGQVGIFSWYSNSPSGYYASVAISDTTPADVQSINPAVIRIAQDDVNGLGWPRYYTIFRATHADSAYAYMVWWFDTNGTYKFDAPMAEIVGRGVTRPSPWRPGAENQLMLVKSETVTLSAGATKVSSTSDKILEAGMVVTDVTYKVSPALGGATSFDIGPSGGTANLFGDNIAVSANTTGSAAVNGNTFTGAYVVPTANTITLTANGSNFTATGAVTIYVHYYRAPEAR